MRRVASLLVLVLVLSPIPLRPQPASDPELQRGIQQTQEGDFEAAVVTLDGVARRLNLQKASPKELSRAYVYLAIAYLGLSQEQAAKAKFLEAWKADHEMKPTASEFPPRVLRLLEEARAEALGSKAPSTQPSPGASGQVSQDQEKKGGSKAPLIVLGVAAAGGGIALAAKGGGSSATPTVTTVAAAPTCSPGQFRAISAVWEQPVFTCPVGSTNPSAVIAVNVANDSTVAVTLTGASTMNNTCTPDPGFTCTYSPHSGLNVAPASVAARAQTTIRVGDVLSCNNTDPNLHGRITFNADFVIQTSCGSVTIRPSNVFTLAF